MEEGLLMMSSSFFISFIKICYSCSNYFLWLMAARPAGLTPFFILKPRPAEEAGLYKALVCAHYGHIF